MNSFICEDASHPQNDIASQVVPVYTLQRSGGMDQTPEQLQGFGRTNTGHTSGSGRFMSLYLGTWLLLTSTGLARAQAAGDLQFDVFLGYGSQPTGAGGIVHDVGWFTVGCEVQNRGPTFPAVFEVSFNPLGQGQTHRLALELPTNTRKRFVLPLFANGSYGSWNARLIDERGQVRAEVNGLRPQTAAWETLLLGALPRTFGGMPALPTLPNDTVRAAQQPAAVRLLPELFPDNPIALEGLDALYLNSDKAPELKALQADALVQWVNLGGHLIVAVEEPAEVKALPWLQSILPFRFEQVDSLQAADAVAAWGIPLTEEPRLPATAGRAGPSGRTSGPLIGFDKYNPAALHTEIQDPAVDPNAVGRTDLVRSEFTVATGTLLEGRVLLAIEGVPLVVRSKQGRGEITLLTFSPEREPFRSWENRSWFWARLLQLPSTWFRPNAALLYGGVSMDSLFGVLLDSRQVRSLSLSWLLLVLAIYLVIIGPLDRYLLKRFRREMWTWVTFPVYVALFSLFIYYLGYRLRAGETEWNELHLVDFLPGENSTAWRGLTYASLYSPVTTRYGLTSALPHATLRGEYLAYAAGGQPAARMMLNQQPSGFSAEVSVPVWTSQLLVSDWCQSNAPPFSAGLSLAAGSPRITIRNELDRPLREVRVAFRGRIYELGEVGAGVELEQALFTQPTRALQEFVFQTTSPLVELVGQRQQAFGRNARHWPTPNGALLSAISLIAKHGKTGQLAERQFVYPRGLDLSSLVDRGDAVVLAWLPDYTPVPPLPQFKAVHARRDTIFRLRLPLESDVPLNPE